MSAHKHTPGPWFGRPYHDPILIQGCDEVGLCIAFTCGGVGQKRDEFKANARLIAAAPELLEALEPFAHATLTHTGQVIGLTREDFERALAAIAKATGEPA